MNNKKICFISCINDDRKYEECLLYINNLNIPEGYEIDIISIKEVSSMAEGYNAAMKHTDAKYKVYLHQDTFIINKNFILDIINIFELNNEIGMVGVVGTKIIPSTCVFYDSKEIYGQVYENNIREINNASFTTVEKEFEEVKAIDGLIMVTNKDIDWREDLFDGSHYYDMSQSLEFIKNGFKVVVPNQKTPWCIHDCNLFDFTNEYEEYKDIYLNEYYNMIFPLVSILIPTYNRPDYFEEALKSVLNQTYKNIEIIIGDDSTNKETKKLIEEKYLDKYKNIKYFYNKKNLGQFENDIRLLKISNGEYINFLMDDDLFNEDKIEKMMNYFLEDSKEEISLVTSNRMVIDEHANEKVVFGDYDKIITENKIFEGKELADNLLMVGENFIGEPTTVLFRKSKLKVPFGTFSGRRYICNVDEATWLNLLCEGKGVFIHESLSSFRKHKDQQQNDERIMINSFLDKYHLLNNCREFNILKNEDDYSEGLKGFYAQTKILIKKIEKNLDKKNNEKFLELNEAILDVKNKLIQYYIKLQEKEKELEEEIKKLPLVSILIPAYNQTNFLKEALESAINQTYKNIEIIIGDDSTNKEVEEFIKPYLEKYKNIIYFKNERDYMDYGHKNVNELLKRAKGEYISFLNHDDVFHPEKTEKMMNYFINNSNIKLVTSVRRPIDKDGNKLKLEGAFNRLFNEDKIISGQSISKYTVENLVNCIGEPTTVLFKKGYIEEDKYGYLNNEKITNVSDLANWINILQYGDLAYINDELSCFRIHENQNSNKINIIVESAIDWMKLIKISYELKIINIKEYKLTLVKCLKNVLAPILNQYLESEESVEESIKKEILRIYNKAMEVIISDNLDFLYECSVCRNKVERFLPYQYKIHETDFYEKFKVIGSDIDNFSCPVCNSHDRERHILKSFEKLDIWNNYIINKSVLHIAPEKYLYQIINKLDTKEYICGDLFPINNSIVEVDITNMKFEDEKFDFIICNHVLEHVLDDKKAMEELYRVLKKDGVALLQTPYSPIIDNSFEDENINTDELRNKFYGQKDHVRIYGLDLFERLKKAGFSLKIIDNERLFSKDESKKYGFNHKENLIIVKK